MFIAPLIIWNSGKEACVMGRGARICLDRLEELAFLRTREQLQTKPIYFFVNIDKCVDDSWRWVISTEISGSCTRRWLQLTDVLSCENKVIFFKFNLHPPCSSNDIGHIGACAVAAGITGLTALRELFLGWVGVEFVFHNRSHRDR
jgi:hypothetical protein